MALLSGLCFATAAGGCGGMDLFAVGGGGGGPANEGGEITRGGPVGVGPPVGGCGGEDFGVCPCCCLRSKSLIASDSSIRGVVLVSGLVLGGGGPAVALGRGRAFAVGCVLGCGGAFACVCGLFAASIALS